MKNTEKNTQKYTQTNILDFCNFQINKVQKTQISNIKKNTKIHQESQNKLKKIAQNRYSKEDSLLFVELVNNLDKNWISIENNKYFIINDKFMVLSNLSNYKELINSTGAIKELFEIYDLDLIDELVTKNCKNEVLKLNKFNYHFRNIRETIQILGFPFKVYQDAEGLLICKNKINFILIAPIFI